MCDGHTDQPASSRVAYATGKLETKRRCGLNISGLSVSVGDSNILRLAKLESEIIEL